MKKKFINLVKKYGKNDILFTFEYCSDYGVELNDSTIDQIEYDSLTDNVLFVYNANVRGDYALYEQFSEEDLKSFYDGLISAIANEENN